MHMRVVQHACQSMPGTGNDMTWRSRAKARQGRAKSRAGAGQGAIRGCNRQSRKMQCNNNAGWLAT